MSKYIRASRFLIAALLATLAWSELQMDGAVEAGAIAAAPTVIRISYAGASRGGARPPTGWTRTADFLVARSQLLPLAPTVTPSPIPSPTATPSPTAIPTKSLGIFKVTGYSDSPMNGTDGRGLTKSGQRTRWGVVAVDPSIIPLGSRLTIDGMDGTLFTALDTGGGVVGRWIDVWFHSDDQAIKHGVKYLPVHLVLD